MPASFACNVIIFHYTVTLQLHALLYSIVYATFYSFMQFSLKSYVDWSCCLTSEHIVYKSPLCTFDVDN